MHQPQNPGSKPNPQPSAIRHSILYPLISLLPLLAVGCVGLKPLKGGKALTTPTPSGGVQQTITQGENPSAPTRQAQETIKLRTYTLPAGTTLAAPQPLVAPKSDERRSPPKSDQAPSSSLNLPPPSILLSAPLTVTEREETRANTELGAAQKDTARVLSAKLSSLKGIVWVGVGLFIFGMASLVWPPLKAIIGSVTTSAVIALGGITLMILPTLIVGNELLILGGVALAVGAWFLAHRHGHLRGQLTLASTTPVRTRSTRVPK